MQLEGTITDVKTEKGTVVDEMVVEGFIKKDEDWHHYAKVGDQEYVDGQKFNGVESYMPLHHKPTKYVVAVRDCFFGVSTVTMWTNSKKKARKFAKAHKGAVVYRATRKNKYVGK